MASRIAAATIALALLLDGSGAAPRMQAETDDRIAAATATH